MNPASRLLRVVTFFGSTQNGEIIGTAWRNYLEKPLADEDELLDVTRAVLAEVRLLERRLQELGVPLPLFVDALTSLKSAFSPTQLSHPWHVHQERMSQRAIALSLSWADWALTRLNEPEVAEEVITALKKTIDDLEAHVASVEIPAGLRDLLERQVAELRIALSLYKVRGVGPVVDAVNRQVSELRNVSEELVHEVEAAGPAARSVVERMKRAVSEAAKFAECGSKSIKFAKEVHELGTTAWHLGQQLLT